MKKLIYMVLIIILALGMAGCSSKESVDLPKAALPEIKFPESVELGFKPLELTQLKEEKPKENWELVKSLPFGSIEDEAVTLLLYKENDSNNLLKAQLAYKEHTYTLLGDVSSSVLEGKSTGNKVKPELVQQSSYLLQHLYGDKENQIFLLGGIELFANGPGMVAYLVFDFKHNTWLQFEEWGIPYLDDLDSDQNKELIIQFPGLHLQSPDVHIIRWYNEQLEESVSFQTALGINAYQPSPVYMERDNNMYFSVDVNTSGDSGMINLGKALYKYEKGKLIKTSF